MPRFVYRDLSIKPRSVIEPAFQVGDVLIVNDNYKHYACEIQIALKPLVNDGSRNRIGHISKSEMELLKLVKDTEAIVFMAA